MQGRPLVENYEQPSHRGSFPLTQSSCSEPGGLITLPIFFQFHLMGVEMCLLPVSVYAFPESYSPLGLHEIYKCGVLQANLL